MALKLGELVAYLRADDTALQKGIRSAQTKLQQAGQKAREHGPMIGAALAAGIGAGLLQGLELDKARAKLAAQVGDPVLAKQLGEVAGRVYGRGFGETAADAMLAARSVMQSGLLPKGADAAVIEDITVKAQTLAQVFDLDVAQAARAAGQMVRNGLAKNAEEALDLITRGFQTSGDQAGDLLDSFSEYSTQFRKLGLSGADAMGLMNQGVQSGARDLDVVGDALKEFAIKAADGSASSAAGFNAIGLNAEKMTAVFAKGGPAAREALGTVLERLQAMKDPTEREAAAVALFGTKAEDLQGALAGLDLDTAAKSLGEVGGAAGKMGDTLEQTSGQKLEAFKRQAQAALVEKLAEAIPVIEATFGWLQRNSGWVGPLATGLGLLAGVIGLIVLGTKLWAAAQIALNVAMMLNPVGLIILAVIGLIAVIVGLWMKFAGFRDFWIMVWEAIKTAAIAVWDFLVAAFQFWWKTFSGFWTGVGRFFVKLWNGIVDGAKTGWRNITTTFDLVVKFVTGLPKRLARAASGMWDGIKNSFRAAVNWIIGKWNNLSLTIGGGSIMGMSIPSVTLATPNIPYLAKGGHIMQAGTAVVGERGPELVHLGRGATVQPLTGGGGGGLSGTLRVILQWPDGRIIRDQIVDAATQRGQSTGRYLGVSTS
ncbi:Phage-related minor tail protein [Micromonospora sp. MW-13]|uniref:phage tail tape measure protein n=1 Tax=Micromonospora sp. MW-13 TaxID=2094022 RepID=UPI000E4414F1|nr:phage tail tape measure protein [Micromonospora sp. MW-13]RGC68418.1 Phage-related minor tail protein [Micromonospora sp. MW-13]